MSTLVQFAWLYLRAWLWARLPGWPRFAAATWGWLALAGLCGLSLHFNRELWPHTPGAIRLAAAGMALGSLAAGYLVLRGLGQWCLAWLPGWLRWAAPGPLLRRLGPWVRAWPPAWRRWALLLVLGPLLGAVTLTCLFLLLLAF